MPGGRRPPEAISQGIWDDLRDRFRGGIVPAMANERKRTIDEHDVQGVKYLRSIGPLLSRLRKVGTERA